MPETLRKIGPFTTIWPGLDYEEAEFALNSYYMFVKAPKFNLWCAIKVLYYLTLIVASVCIVLGYAKNSDTLGYTLYILAIYPIVSIALAAASSLSLVAILCDTTNKLFDELDGSDDIDERSLMEIIGTMVGPYIPEAHIFMPRIIEMISYFVFGIMLVISRQYFAGAFVIGCASVYLYSWMIHRALVFFAIKGAYVLGIESIKSKMEGLTLDDETL